MTSFSFWQKWLLLVSMGITAFGIMMALLSGSQLFDLFNRHIDPAFWTANAAGEGAKEFQKWIYGVWGATIAGWGIVMVLVVHYPFANKQRWAWNCIFAGVLVWYALDTLISLNYGVYFNVGFNTALLLLLMMPLIFTKQHFA